MSANEFVLVQGIHQTRGALERWRHDPDAVLGPWIAASVAIAAGLLTAVWIVSLLVRPDPTPLSIAGLTHSADAGDFLYLLGRNGLVLALHATACVAGFIAGSSMPRLAEARSGFSRWIHDKAGRVAIWWVVIVTVFSLLTQAFALGFIGASLASQLGISSLELVLTALPHAMIELTAVFLPLAAWLVASRRGEWSELLAATFATVVVAIPMLVVSALLELTVWPKLLTWVSPILG